MADWNDLVDMAHQTVSHAQGYLQKRLAETTDVREKELLEQWRETLEASVKKVKPQVGKVTVLKEPVWKIYSEQLDFSKRHVDALHGYFDYATVESVLGVMNKHLRVMAGPNGPGGGKPGAGGPGGGRPGIRGSNP